MGEGCLKIRPPAGFRPDSNRESFNIGALSGLSLPWWSFGRFCYFATFCIDAKTLRVPARSPTPSRDINRTGDQVHKKVLRLGSRVGFRSDPHRENFISSSWEAFHITQVVSARPVPQTATRQAKRCSCGPHLRLSFLGGRADIGPPAGLSSHGWPMGLRVPSCALTPTGKDNDKTGQKAHKEA